MAAHEPDDSSRLNRELQPFPSTCRYERGCLSDSSEGIKGDRSTHVHEVPIPPALVALYPTDEVQLLLHLVACSIVLVTLSGLARKANVEPMLVQLLAVPFLRSKRQRPESVIFLRS